MFQLKNHHIYPYQNHKIEKTDMKTTLFDLCQVELLILYIKIPNDHINILKSYNTNYNNIFFSIQRI